MRLNSTEKTVNILIARNVFLKCFAKEHVINESPLRPSLEMGQGIDTILPNMKKATAASEINRKPLSRQRTVQFEGFNFNTIFESKI